MPRVSVPFSLGSYQGRTRVATFQRLVNLYPEQVEALNSNSNATPRVVLINAPGIREYVTTDNDLSNINGLHSAGGFIWAVSQNSVYRVTVKETPYIKKIGAGNFNRNITMADNLNTELGSQVWFSDGVKGYVIDTNSLTVSQINDDSFFPASSTAFLNGYAVWTRRGTGQFFWSAINDATSYNALDFATAEADSDNLLRVVNFENDIWLFGEETVEIWSTTASAAAPFRRINNAIVRPGSISGMSVAIIDNNMFWVGSDLSVYAVSGRTFQPTRISKHQGVENDLYRYGGEDAYGFTTAHEGHKFYWLQLPNASKTWVYDLNTGAWHERASLDWRCKLNEFKRECWNYSYGEHIARSSILHKGYYYIGHANGLGRLDVDYFRDLDKRILREAISAPIQFFGERQTIVNTVELEFQRLCFDSPVLECCNEVENNPINNPNAVSLDTSTDLGETWSTPRWRLFSSGGTKQFNKRSVWNRNGLARRKAWRWRTFFDGPIVFAQAIFDVEGRNAA